MSKLYTKRYPRTHGFEVLATFTIPLVNKARLKFLIPLPVVKPEILSVITEHYTRGQPIFTEEPEDDDLKINEDDSEAVQLIKEII